MRVQLAARMALALGAFVSPTAAWPQPAAVSPATSAAPTSCKPIPYTVGTALEGAEVAGKFGSGALARLLKLPDLSGRAGVEVVSSAYAGLSIQAMSEVFDALGCRVKAFIKDTDTDADKKRAAVTLAIARLNGEMAFIQSAYSNGMDGVGALREQYLNATRSEAAPVLDYAITNAALASIDTDKLFINGRTTKWWGGLDVGSAISVQGCGGVVQAAIADGGSALQRGLASTREILINYLDPNVPLVVPLAKLMLATAPPTFKVPGPAFVGSFQNCTQALTKAQTESSAKAASAPALGSGAATASVVGQAASAP